MVYTDIDMHTYNVFSYAYKCNAFDTDALSTHVL
jgi:hypothetical protein